MCSASSTGGSQTDLQSHVTLNLSYPCFRRTFDSMLHPYCGNLNLEFDSDRPLFRVLGDDESSTHIINAGDR
jgi:hypothetical protein